MTSRVKGRGAEISYSIASRSDKTPRVGDTIQLGKQEYTVTGLRVRVELRPIVDDSDEPEYEE